MSSYVCDSFYTNDCIRQGTIIKFLNAKQDVLYGVVVTKDCDIAQDKYGKFLSWCPIISFSSYVDDFYIPKMCKQTVQKKKMKLKKSVETNLERNDLSESTFDFILKRTEPELKKMGITDQSCIKTIIELKNIWNKEFFDKNDFELLNCSMKDICHLPGDKFFIDEIPDSAAPALNMFVDLRRIREIEISCIETTYLSENSATCDCVALAKMKAPYKQRMVQQLGSLFSDIGMPSEYESKFTQVCDEICKE